MKRLVCLNLITIVVDEVYGVKLKWHQPFG